MRVPPIHAAPAQVVGKPRRLRALHQFLQPPQVLAIGLLRRTEVHGHAVLHHFVLFQDLIEDAHGPPAIDQEILGINLETVAHRLARQNMIGVRRAQPYPNPVLGKPIKSICRHFPCTPTEASRRASDAHQPPYRRESSALRSGYDGFFSSSGILLPSPLQPPLPLQEFWPLQACFSFTFLSAFFSVS